MKTVITATSGSICERLTFLHGLTPDEYREIAKMGRKDHGAAL